MCRYMHTYIYVYIHTFVMYISYVLLRIQKYVHMLYIATVSLHCYIPRMYCQMIRAVHQVHKVFLASMSVCPNMEYTPRRRIHIGTLRTLRARPGLRSIAKDGLQFQHNPMRISAPTV